MGFASVKTSAIANQVGQDNFVIWVSLVNVPKMYFVLTQYFQVFVRSLAKMVVAVLPLKSALAPIPPTAIIANTIDVLSKSIFKSILPNQLDKCGQLSIQILDMSQIKIAFGT